MVNPKEFNYSINLVNNSYTCFWLSNTFCAFKSINDIFYIIYTNDKLSIISFDMIICKKINEIQNAHLKKITNLRYYLDKINTRDLLISISGQDNNLKLWDIEKFECILDMRNINSKGFLNSSILLIDNNKHYLVTSNDDYEKIKTECIKIFDLKGNKIKDINDSNEVTYFIDIYYDEKSSINYIIACNRGNIISYNYKENKLYHEYYDFDNGDRGHFSAIIHKEKKLIKLIESSCDGNIRIWNFHTSDLLDKIEISGDGLREICLWDENYLFVGCDDSKIFLIDIKGKKIIKELEGHDDKVLSIKKIDHPQYGICLISQGVDGLIKLWKKIK